MPSLFTEDTYEQAIIELFENMGYDHLYAPDFDRDYTSPILDSILRDSLVRINRGLPVEAIDEALAKLKNFDTGSGDIIDPSPRSSFSMTSSPTGAQS